MQRSSRFPIRIPIALLLAASTLPVFLQTGHHPFISLDDGDYVTGNPFVSHGLTLDGARWAFTTLHASNWHPLTWLSHMTDVSLFGMNPGPHHLVNVFLHAANTFILFLMLSRMTETVWRSAFVAALFAVHPLHVESVAWVAERKDLLCAFFFLLTLLAYGRYAERPGKGRYAAAIIPFALALLSKPMAVTLPFVLLLLDFWPLERVARLPKDPAGGDGSPGVPLRILLLEKVPFIALSAISSAITITAQSAGGAVVPSGIIPYGMRIANIPVAYAEYLGQMFWPSSLSIIYPHPEDTLPFWKVGIASGLLALVSILAVWNRNRRPWLLTGWLWYLGMLVPVIGLVQAGMQARADRYTYLPSIGIFLIGAWVAGELVRRFGIRPWITAGVSGIVLVALAGTARVQTRYWDGRLAPYLHALEVTDRNWLAHYNLGTELLEEGKYDDALAHLREALRIKPDYFKAHSNAGVALLRKGSIDEATSHFRKALSVNPKDILAWTSLADILVRQGRKEEAARCYAEALSLSPDSPRTRNNYGTLLESMGMEDEAAAQYREAIRLKPDYLFPYVNLGSLLGRRGNLTDATPVLREAVRLGPENADTHYNLAVALLLKNDGIDEALAHLREALRLSPTHAPARKKLDEALSRKIRSPGGA